MKQNNVSNHVLMKQSSYFQKHESKQTEKNKLAVVQNSILDFKKYRKELKHTEKKIRKETEELSTEVIPLPRPKKTFYGKSRPAKLVSTLNNMRSTDIDKFEKEEIIKKIPLAKNTWYDWLINYILNSIERQRDRVIEKIMSLFKIKNINEDKRKAKDSKKLYDRMKKHDEKKERKR